LTFPEDTRQPKATSITRLPSTRIQTHQVKPSTQKQQLQESISSLQKQQNITLKAPATFSLASATHHKTATRQLFSFKVSFKETQHQSKNNRLQQPLRNQSHEKPCSSNAKLSLFGLL